MNVTDTLKKVFALKNIMIALAIIAILSIVKLPGYIKTSRNKASRDLLSQIVLAEMSVTETEIWSPPIPYVFTDGAIETAESAIKRLARFGFRPDPSVAFHIMPAVAADGRTTPYGFVVIAAHKAVGSSVYVYDNLYNNIGTNGIVEAREGAEYGGVKFTSSTAILFRYKYDDSTKTVKRISGGIKFGPEPKPKYGGRMLVAVSSY